MIDAGGHSRDFTICVFISLALGESRPTIPRPSALSSYELNDPWDLGWHSTSPSGVELSTSRPDIVLMQISRNARTFPGTDEQMKQTYVLEVDGKPKMVFREKDDAAAANWNKGAAIWVEGNPGWHGTMTTRQATIPEQAAWRAHSVEMTECDIDTDPRHSCPRAGWSLDGGGT
jgi:hypothetical protein